MSPMSPDMFEFGDIVADDSGVMGILMGIYLIIMMFSMAYSVVVYVLSSLGMYTIAKRRGIHHAWMSWISPLSIWILGSISDQYQYVAKGRVRNRRKVLLGLYIAMMVLLICVVVAAVAMLISIDAAGDPTAEMGIGFALAFIGIYLAALVISIVELVFLYMCYYDLFASSNPDNAVTFLVLSIFFTFLLPFFVFACRKKDLGMPPRKPRLPEAPWQPAPPPPAPTWQPPAQQTPPAPPTWQPPQQNAWQPPQQNAWQPPQQNAWQPPQQNAWQPPQQNAWQPPVNAWQAPAQPEQPASVQTEPAAPASEAPTAEEPKTEE